MYLTNNIKKLALMKIFSGFNKKDKGIILFDGKEAEINNPRDAISMGISTIYQDIIKSFYVND